MQGPGISQGGWALRERLSEPAGGSGTYGSSENQRQAARCGLSKGAVWGEVERKQGPKNNPSAVRSESTWSDQEARKGSLAAPVTSCRVGIPRIQEETATRENGV